jgi:hypothetical protein
MRKLLLITAMLFCVQHSSRAQIYVDSAKIVQLDNTHHGVALYGVVMTCPARVIDSAQVVSNDTVLLTLCYLYGNAVGDICRANDTFELNISALTDYTVIAALARTDSFTNSCNSPQKKDTIVLHYMYTGLVDVGRGDAIKLFPNPAGNILQGNIEGYATATDVSITSTTGQLLLQSNIVLPNFTIDVSTLPPGLYFLQLTVGNSRLVKRFAKY